MKRRTAECLQESVEEYLKRRNYKPKKVEGSETMTSMVTRLKVNRERSCPTGISYSSHSNDTASIEQQFLKLKQMISGSPESCRRELSQILFPVYIHLYLEMVKNGSRLPATRFLKRHLQPFLKVEKYNAFLNLVQTLSNSLQIMDNPQVKDFRNSRYKVFLSEDSFQHLMNFLRSDNNLMLVQVLNCHLHLTLVGGGGMESLEEGAISSSSTSSDPSVALLEEVFRQVREGPPTRPSICCYTATSQYGVTSMNVNGSMVAVGYENSSIKLWSSDGVPLPQPDNITKIPLAPGLIDAPSPGSSTSPSPSSLLMGHSGAVYDVAFSGDGTLLYSCGEDCTIRIWKRGTNKAVYRAHHYPVWALDCNSLSGQFVSGSMDRTARLWCTERVYPVRTYAGHYMDVDSVKIHPNGTYLATGSADKSVRLWSLHDGRVVRVLTGHHTTVLALAFSPDGRLLASAGQDGLIRLWDLSEGLALNELSGHRDTIYSLAFPPHNSSMLVSAGNDSVIKLWDLQNTGSCLETYPTDCSPIMRLNYVSGGLLYAAGVT